jgi:protein NUD1
MTKPMPSLRILKLSGNKLKKLDVAPFPRLRTLYADNNLLSVVKHGEELSWLENISLRNQRTPEL